MIVLRSLLNDRSRISGVPHFLNVPGSWSSSTLKLCPSVSHCCSPKYMKGLAKALRISKSKTARPTGMENGSGQCSTADIPLVYARGFQAPQCAHMRAGLPSIHLRSLPGTESLREPVEYPGLLRVIIPFVRLSGRFLTLPPLTLHPQSLETLPFCPFPASWWPL